jgi:N-acetyl-gamma-glutamyl-phosphate reductase
VDLSADFRLRDRGEYERWYGPHGAPELFGCGIYGLPELYGEQVADADLVANPGCYPTATLLALAPLAASGSVVDVVVDAKSGISGAGRAPTPKTHFVTMTENVVPYGVGAHRHMPEIDQELAVLGAPVTTTFTPHLLPLDQGELVSCYVTTAAPVDQAEVDAAFARDYADEPFVELTTAAPGVRDVRDTNICRIHARADERTGKVFVFAAIDNLWKGTSSQAVQSLNLMLGLDETAGIA